MDPPILHSLAPNLSKSIIIAYFSSHPPTIQRSRSDCPPLSYAPISSTLINESISITTSFKGTAASPYEITLLVGGGGRRIVSSSCSCPSGEIGSKTLEAGRCKHVAGLLFALLSDTLVQREEVQRVDLSAPPKTVTMSEVMQLLKKKRSSFHDSDDSDGELAALIPDPLKQTRKKRTLPSTFTESKSNMSPYSSKNRTCTSYILTDTELLDAARRHLANNHPALRANDHLALPEVNKKGDGALTSQFNQVERRVEFSNIEEEPLQSATESDHD